MLVLAALLPGSAMAASHDTPAAHAGETPETWRPDTWQDIFGAGKQHLGVAAGFGLGLPLGGGIDTELEKVEILLVIPQWGIGLTNPKGHDRWYYGNVELIAEGQVLINTEPRTGFGGGVSALVRYNFLRHERVIPFVEGGAGIAILDFNLSGQADDVNFLPQGGLGVHYFVSRRVAITPEWRLHHISNAGTQAQNNGINDSLFLIGLSWFLAP